MSEKRQVWTVAVLLPLLVLGCACSLPAQGGGVEREVEAALDQAETLAKAGQWTEVRVVLARAEGRLGSGGPEALRRRVARMVKDVELVIRLNEIRLVQTDGKDGAAARYAKAFRAYGIDVPALKAEEAVARVRESAVRRELLAGLDAWAMVTPPGEASKALQALLDGADDDAWRKALRQAVAGRDAKKLTKLASESAAAEQPPAVLLALAEALGRTGQTEQAEKILRQGQRHHPADFWLNHQLGVLLLQGASRDEAVGFFRAALALRPDSPGVRINLGQALMAQGKLDEATACFRAALALDPASAPAHNHLGRALQQEGKLAEAVACYQKAIRLAPTLAPAHSNLGLVLAKQGKLDEAVACLREAIRLDPRVAEAHLNLGSALEAKGLAAEAAACYRRAIELDPRLSRAHASLGGAFFRQGKLDEAIACYRKAIALDPRSASAHLHLGHALRSKGDREGATAAYRKALELQPDLAAAKKALEATRKGDD